jgi:hypothetical protein
VPMPTRTALVLVVVALLSIALGAAMVAGAFRIAEPPIVFQPETEVIIPPGVISTQTADQVSNRMLGVIADNERAVGRALAPPRIIRIQLLRPGDAWSIVQLDGTGSMGGGVDPEQHGPAWLVEAVGTFIDPIGRDGGLPTSIGTHGYRIWGDNGRGSYDWFPCWVRTLDEFNAGNMEGVCAAPAP